MARRRSAPSPTVVFDIGGVLSAAHTPEEEICEILGVTPAELAEPFWQARPAYDEGEVSAREYWDAVTAALGMEPPSEEILEDLIAADCGYWLRLDPASRALIHDLARNGVRLGLLSNAPVDFAQACRRADWYEVISLAVFSGEERIAKPDAEIYRILLDEVAPHTGGVAVPGRVIFFDDREENVAAAKELGIDAHLWPRNGDGHAVHGADLARRVLEERDIPLT
ncbi:HAD family hydrolase [Dermabacteraceae bacterium P7006]